jgi:hypothetical protein
LNLDNSQETAQMQSSDGVARDWIIALAWASAMGWLKLLVLVGRIAGRLQRAPSAEGEPAGAGDACAKVSRLQRIAERGVWRCETIAALNADAQAAIEQAEDELDQARAFCAIAMARPREREARSAGVLAA